MEKNKWERKKLKREEVGEGLSSSDINYICINGGCIYGI